MHSCGGGRIQSAAQINLRGGVSSEGARERQESMSRRISPEYLKDFSVSSKQWSFSSLDQPWREAKGEHPLEPNVLPSLQTCLRTRVRYSRGSGGVGRVLQIYSGDCIELLSNGLQQLGKVTVPLVEFELPAVKNLLRHLYRQGRINQLH